MPIVKMDRVTAVGLRQDKTAVVEALMKLGAVDIDAEPALAEADDGSAGLLTADAALEKEQLLTVGHQQLSPEDLPALLARLEQAIAECSRLRPVKKPMFAGKRMVSNSEFNRVVASQSDVIANLAALESARTRIAEIDSQLIRLQNTEAMLQPWEGVAIDLSEPYTLKTRTFLGSFRSRSDLESLERSLADEAPETVSQILNEDETGVRLLVITLRIREALVLSALRRLSFTFLPVQADSATPGLLLRHLHSEQADLRLEREKLQGRLAGLATGLVDFEILHAHLQMLHDKYAVLRRLAGTGQTFVLQGWVPERLTDSVRKGLESRFTIAFDSRRPEPGENFPILLENRKLVQPYEAVVEMFNPPLPSEVDPTPVLAPFYFLFFGMMLSDVGYGLMLSAICLLGIYGLKLKGRTRQTAFLFLQCGISSIFWGFMFGGYFGDMISTVSSGRVNIPPVLFDPLKSPTSLMILSAVFGVIHLFSGMSLKAYMAFRSGDWQTAVFDVFPWFFLILGLGLSIAGIGAPVSGYLAIFGAAVIVLFTGRSSRNPVARIGLGLYNLYGATAYFGDILSYTRVLALVLATSVIAMVVNKIGFLGGPSFIGYIVFVLVAILGHTINFALSLLSAYIHTSRLQFVEFFTKFYEGGGRIWKPERLKAKFIEIERAPEAAQEHA